MSSDSFTEYENPFWRREFPYLFSATRPGDTRRLTSTIKRDKSASTTTRIFPTVLMMAVKIRSLVCCKLLVKVGASLDARDFKGRTAVMLAVQAGSVRCLRYLVDEGADTEIVDDEHLTPLLAAVKFDQLDCLCILLQRGANPNVWHHGVPVLVMAARNEDPDFLRYLIAAGANMNKMDLNGFTALMVAARRGKYEHVELLVEAGADIQAKNFNDETALMMAVESNSWQCVSYLIQMGANVSGCSADGRTAVMRAVSNANPYIMDLLLRASSDSANATDRQGRTALMRILLRSDGRRVDCTFHKLFKSLITYYWTDVNVQDSEGKTALMLALLSSKDTSRTPRETSWTYTRDGGDEGGPDTQLTQHYRDWVIACVQALLYNGSDVNMVDKNGRTALQHAMYAGQHYCLPLLLEYNAEIDHVDNQGRTALMVAINRGDIYQVHKLMMGGADLNLKNLEGDTPLMQALKLPEERFERIANICEKMLRYGADVSTRNCLEQTPLMLAMKNKCCDIHLFEAMVMEGADVNAVDKLKCSVLVHALQADFEREAVLDRVTWLLQRGAEPFVGHHSNSLIHVLGGRLVGSGQYMLTWQNVNELITEGRDDIIRLVVCSGLIPTISDVWSPSFSDLDANATPTVPVTRTTQHWRKEEVAPPFIFALIHKRVDIAKYFMANLFLTQFDRIIGIRYYLEDFLDEEGSRLLAGVQSRPLPLVKLASMAVSYNLGLCPGRELRVRQTGLPVPLQRMLLFQTPMAKLCPHQWEDIPLPSCDCGSPDSARPLLQYWPLCQCSFPKCDDTECFNAHRQFVFS